LPEASTATPQGSSNLAVVAVPSAKPFVEPAKVLTVGGDPARVNHAGIVEAVTFTISPSPSSVVMV
jgi:hypothetical protein